MTIHTLVLHKGVWSTQCVYTYLQNMSFLHLSIVRQLLHSVCSFIHFVLFCVFFYYTNHVTFYTLSLLIPINLRYFVVKFICRNLCVFRCNFCAPKFCPCKKITNIRYAINTSVILMLIQISPETYSSASPPH